MDKLKKISEIKKTFYSSFQKPDRIVNTTNLGEELHVLVKVYNLKEYLKKKISDIEAVLNRI